MDAASAASAGARTRLLCNTALFLVQLSASINVSLSRTAFSWYDPATQEPVAPVVFGTVRSIFGLSIFVAVRYYWQWAYVSVERQLQRDDAISSKVTAATLAASRNPSRVSPPTSLFLGALVVNESIVSMVEVISPAVPIGGSPAPTERTTLVATDVEASQGKMEPSAAEVRDTYLRSVDLSRGDCCRVMALGVIGIPVNLLCFLTGVSLTDGITTGAFASTIPVVCFMVARVLRVEMLTFTKVLAVTFVVAGNCTMVEVWRTFGGGSGTRNHPPSYYRGCVAFLGNVFAWSVYLVLQKPLLKRVHRLEFLFWFYVGGVSSLVLYAVLTDGALIHRQVFTPGLLSHWSWLSMVYAGCVNATVPYWLLAYGIEHGGPVLASAWNATQPILLTIEALTFLGESLSLPKGVGGLVVLVGVALTVAANAPARTSAAAAAPPSQAAGAPRSMLRESPRHAESQCDLSRV